MPDAVKDKKYIIDFYCLSMQPTAELPSVASGLDSIIDSELSPHADINGYVREIWKPIKRSRPRISYAGQFRKFRQSDLPEIGAAGEDAAELELEDGQGLVERNFFIYYPAHSLLAWCRNAHGSTTNQFARFLSNVWSTKVTSHPVLEHDAARRLMRNGVVLKKIIVTIPRPTSPDMYAETEFNETALGLLNDAAADSIHMEMGVDARRADSSGGLVDGLKRALAEAVGLGASTARAIVIDDGIEHPIDLIADRVFSVQEIETNAKYPPSGTMYAAIDAARHECEELINDYFGSLGGALT